MNSDIIRTDWPVTDISANVKALENVIVYVRKDASVSWLDWVAPRL